MKKLILCLLLLVLSPGVSNANQAPIGFDSIFNTKIELLDEQASPHAESSQRAQISLQTVAVPPAIWVVGFGLCLVLLGCLLRNKAP